MACFFSSKISCASFKFDLSRSPSKISSHNNIIERNSFALTGVNTELFGQQVVGTKVKPWLCWSFVGVITTLRRPNLGKKIRGRKSSVVHASSLLSSEIASSAFTFGTVAVLPFYTFMVVAPKAEITKKVASSSIPYIVLGTLYAYLLSLSWTPDTIRLMFASKYWLPELPGIAKMFSNEMTMASAWIHLLAVDLFAARQVYFDGQQNNIETRHSVSLCLLFCPVGILAHFITKAVSKRGEQTDDGILGEERNDFR